MEQAKRDVQDFHEAELAAVKQAAEEEQRAAEAALFSSRALAGGGKVGDGGVDDADARLVKIHGAGGPGSVGLDGVDSTMKYDSGTREFKPLATSGRLTPLTAAVTLVSRK